jgi:lipopolysaccharide export system protein LptA
MIGAGRAVIRYTTMVLIVGVLAAIAFVGYQRTRLNGSRDEVVDREAVGIDVADVAVGLYRGFRHTETLRGKPLFVLDSLRTLSLASGWQEIEGVRLQLFREGESGPVLTAERASFNIDTRDARLEGGIHVEFPNGAFLNTEVGRFKSRSQVFESEAPVLYVDGPTFGQAERASYDLSKDLVRLSGKAAFRTDDGAMLVSPKMVYRRNDRTVSMTEGVILTRGLSRVTAPRAVVSLSEDDGPIERVELSGGVSARTTVESTGAPVELWSERVIATADATGNWQVTARTTGPWVEVRFIGGPGFYQRTLRTVVLGAVVGEEGIVSMRTEHGVCLEEIPAEGPPRSAQADQARAWFNAGQLTDVELDGAVEMYAANVLAHAQRARLVQSSGLVMLQGDPTGRNRVRLESDRGRMICDQAILFDREGRIEARGQVHGELRNARLFGAQVDPEEGEPVRFAGDTLEVTEEGGFYSLKDDARVWQGHRLLLADDVSYHHDEQTVQARGHVRATFPARQMDAEASQDDDVVVVSRSLDYDALAGRALFRGSVRYSDPKYSLSANRLSVSFDDNDEISDVEAEGTVELIDLVTGRRLTGQHARREVARQVITVTGTPAQLFDERGNVASGESLTWNQADGTVSIGGGTELIYYPETDPESAQQPEDNP